MGLLVALLVVLGIIVLAGKANEATDGCLGTTVVGIVIFLAVVIGIDLYAPALRQYDVAVAFLTILFIAFFPLLQLGYDWVVDQLKARSAKHLVCEPSQSAHPLARSRLSDWAVSLVVGAALVVIGYTCGHWWSSVGQPDARSQVKPSRQLPGLDTSSVYLAPPDPITGARNDPGSATRTRSRNDLPRLDYKAPDDPVWGTSNLSDQAQHK